MGKELFYTNEIKIGYFTRSGFQALSTDLSGSALEFGPILIANV